SARTACSRRTWSSASGSTASRTAVSTAPARSAGPAARWACTTSPLSRSPWPDESERTGAMNHWSTHQLTEFFAAVCAPQQEGSAIMVAVERATEVLETEIGAVLRDGRVEVAWGVAREVLQAALNGDER